MTRTEQCIINEKVRDFMRENSDLISASGIHEWTQLRSCSAKVANVGCFWVLKSYNTVIAVIDKRTHTLYDFLRYVYHYTATSAQHISKFARDYDAETTLRYYPV